MDRTGWFADVADPEDRVEGWEWQPFLQVAGCCFPLLVRHQTKEACEEFIRRNVIGQGMLPDA